MSRSMLSNLAHAKCRVAPGDDEVKALRSLYELAASNQEEQFIDWDELLRRRLALCWAPHLPTNTCVSCGAACTDCGTPDLDNPDDSDAPEPADDSATTVEPVVPVPHGKGDRHNNERIDVAWTAVDDVTRYVADGDLTRLNSVLRYAGTEAPATETARAIAACRDRQMHDAAATIIGHAGSRAEREVLEILLELNQNDRRADADAVLERALGRGRS
ncbi:hypothetical protein [Nocardia seriolae]|uniref:hypothetical protein n=1 Tax=Nocardia seriolae TaxID=37332 RepID=UPI0011807156|nr:hypothetical protein [Nocardia seriolae]MTJ76428.1 hypothetical protein [Nocardia seriolae]MTJ90077.1 hypothetical protein [Nocardia seriolae]MTK50655.1 hypothetical protein [Nocardia seriolae]